ncbi:aminopeptidase, partial [bacterium]|nr:aminopeptidase [bacterium]
MRREDLYRDVDKQILGEAMVSDQAVDTLRHLCDTIGNRMAGSTGERRAGDYVRACFTRIGLDNVQVEAFPFLAWERKRKPVLKLTRPGRASFASIALPYSPKTPKGGIDVEVVDVGDGLPEDFHRLRHQIRGRAVLTTSESPGYYHRWVHRAEKYALAVKRGAKAFLFANHVDGLLA